MALSRIAASLAGAALLLLAPSSAHAAVGDPVVTLDKPLYQTGESATMTVTGTPGHQLWLLFEKNAGPTTIPGLGTFGLMLGAGLEAYPIGVLPADGTFTASCAPDCSSEAAASPTYIQAITFDPLVGMPLALSNTTVLQVARGDECNTCPKTPSQDPLFGVTSAGTAVYLHGIGNDFVFAPGATFAEYNDGTARLTGEIYRPTVPTERFLLDTSFTSFMGPNDPASPPAGSPKLELAPGAYMDAGGPIDARTWHYYPVFNGLLIGLGDFAGGTIAFGRMGPAFQVGEGANGKDLTYGGSGWLNVSVLTQPTSTTWNATGGGDINISIGDCPPLGQPLCTVAAAPDAFEPLQLAPHAVVSFGFDGKYIFTGNGGDFTEFPDGSARLKGELIQVVDPTKKWDLDVLFTNKIDVGSPQNPPAGSPKLELLPTAYVWNGGPIDPAAWHYYTDFTGTMTGKETYDGASLLITRRGPAFQVGDGASGKNIAYGASAWNWFDVITQPTQGPALPLHTDGDINVNFVICP